MSIYHGAAGTEPAGTALVLDSNTAIASTKPSWSLYKLSHVTDFATSVVTYNNERSPSTNCTVNAGAGTVTITVPGKYYISFDAFGELNADTTLSVYIRKNGVQIVRGYSDKTANQYGANLSTSCILDLVAGDVMDVSIAIGAVHSNDNTSFCGFMM